jgi:hypothetical protein
VTGAVLISDLDAGAEGDSLSQPGVPGEQGVSGNDLGAELPEERTHPEEATMTTTLTLDDLARAVANVLTVAGLPYHDDELRAYLEAVWGRVELDPDPDYWARRYAAWVELDIDPPVV